MTGTESKPEHFIVEATDANFKELVLESKIPVVVNFGNLGRCPPCRMIHPFFEKLSAEFKGRILVVKVDSDTNPETRAQFAYQGIPHVFFIANGKHDPSMTICGGFPFSAYKKAFDKLAADYPVATAKISKKQAAADEAFATAAAAAQAKFDAVVLPAREKWKNSTAPLLKRAEHKKSELDKAVAAGKITQEESDKQYTELSNALTPEMAPHTEAYYAVAKPAEEAFKADMDAATEAHKKATAKKPRIKLTSKKPASK